MKINKTILMSAVALMASSVIVKGQSTTSGTAGNNYAPTSFLGWGTASGDLPFKVNGNTKMVLQNTTGNFGIGTTNPLHRLHVSGNLLVNGSGANILIGGTTAPNGEWGMEYTYGGLNFWKPSGSSTFGNYFIFIKDNGNVGIGMPDQPGVAPAPIQKLDVNGRMQVRDGVIQRGGAAITTTSDLGLYSLVAGNYMRFVTNGAPFKFFSDGNINAIGGTQIMSLEANGKLILGTVSSTPGNYRLYVQGGIMTERARVAVSGTADWADYVFADNYKLKTITELETYVKSNKHLPNVPSAQDVVNEGIDIAKMDAKLLEKIEELSLYIIQLKNENMELLKRVENLESK
jgi:hypothetical protein